MKVEMCYFLLTLLTPYDQNIDLCVPLNYLKEVVTRVTHSG